jgi:hypothetical protein
MYDVIIFRVTLIMGFILQITKEKFFSITHTTFSTPVGTPRKHSALWILKLQTLYPREWGNVVTIRMVTTFHTYSITRRCVSVQLV